MDLHQIQDNLQKCSTDSENIFLKVGTSFPELLALNKNTEDSSLSALLSLLQTIADGFSGNTNDEAAFFTQYSTQNSALFNDLNDKMKTLSLISDRVSSIRSDSEELEIIALNAMIVSIKSGEKGRAFSCITENLKSLSARMIELSNGLLLDQARLLEKNESLKTSFLSVGSTQNELLASANSGEKSEILGIIDSASASLGVLQRTAEKITPPILEAMGGIQLQDIIRQSIDQILLALAEVKPLSLSLPKEEKLDRVTLNSELLSISARISQDVGRNLESSIDIFSLNWAKVHAILDEVEQLRVQFISTYLDEKDAQRNSLPVHLERMNTGFSEYIKRISLYQRGKKTMVRESSLIVQDVKHLRVLYDSIHPIIQRLQHVRINQQIEVAKNAALSSIFETVNYMSDLINQSDLRVQDTRKELVQFISDIENLIAVFSFGSEVENKGIEEIKKEKNAFFITMKGFEQNLARTVEGLQVYPDSFQTLCREIDSLLSDLKDIASSVSRVSLECDRQRQVFQTEREKLLADSGLEGWTLANNEFRLLVDRFTITSHKEAAGKIGGFEVENESLGSIQAGDATFFF